LFSVAALPLPYCIQGFIDIRRRASDWRGRINRGLAKNQKLAACGSSYREMHSKVGAAEGCDLLILPMKTLYFLLRQKLESFLQ
jgi:hypothetical protein